MNREQIIALQRDLIAGGYLPQGSADGNFGPQTQLAQQRMLADRGARQERLGKQEIEKQRAAAAAAQAAAASAKAQAEKASAEAAAEARRVQSAKEAAEIERTKKKNKEVEAYHGTPLGMGMQALDAAAPILGAPMGGYLAHRIYQQQMANERALNEQRRAQATAYEAVRPGSPGAQAKYQSIAEASRAGGLIPESPQKVTRKRFGTYGWYGVPLAAEGLVQRILAEQAGNTPFSQDVWRDTGTMNMGAGLATLAAGQYFARNPGEIPDADALRKIALAEKTAKDLASKAKPLQAPEEPPVPSKPASGTTIRGGGLAPYEGRGAHVAARLWSDLGGDPKTVTKKARLAGLPALIDNASEDAVRTAAHLAGYHDTTEPRQALKTFAKGVLSETKPIKAIPRVGALLAPALATGFAAGTPSPVKAEDYGYAPGESALLPGMSRAQEALWRARQAAAGVTENAPYFVPYLGEALMARDLAGEAAGTKAFRESPETPEEAYAFKQSLQSDRNIREAQAEDRRQRAELFKERPELAPVGERPPIPEEVLFPAGSQQPPNRAAGGAVNNVHMRGIKTRLIAMQKELHGALSRTSKHLSDLQSRKGADGASKSKEKSQKELIEDIWSLHELSKKIMGGKLSIHPSTSKEELINIARKQQNSSSQAA
jgi:hypothetical protein